MVLIDTEYTASQILRTFHRDEPFLFLGAAFTTVGIVAAAFCVFRRRFDALLIWLAIFAFLYGQRMWMQVGLLRITVPVSPFFDQLRAAITYLVAIPAFYFFRAAGFLGRGGKVIITLATVVFPGLVLGTWIFGPLRLFDQINTTVITGMLWVLVARSLGKNKPDRDFKVVRVGVLVFVALALWDNIAGRYWRMPIIEPYGFAVLLSCLGYVTARRMVERDVKLGEIQIELDLARRIQHSLLPGAFPNSHSFRVAARYVPMTSVAGDLYDFLLTGEQQAGLLVADVSGHGVPAALIASMVKMAATTQRAHAAHPADLLAGMNQALSGNTQGELVTAAYAYLDANAGELRYAAAGHPAMLLLRNGTVTEVSENGLPLGASESAAYSEATVQIEPGDRLMLYTDGLVEARNTEGELFGEERLASAMVSSGDMSTEVAAQRMIASAEQWGKTQLDDLTVLICDFLPVS